MFGSKTVKSLSGSKTLTIGIYVTEQHLRRLVIVGVKLGLLL
jgi:hypothetical protein